MLVCYIAGAYTAKNSYQVKRNIYTADLLSMSVIEQLGHMGVVPVCPHANTAHFEGIQSAQWFYDATMELLKRSDLCIYVPGSEETSSGTIAEIKYCTDNNVPCFRGDEQGIESCKIWLTKNAKLR